MAVTAIFRLPLLPAQTGAWYSQQVDRESPALNIAELVRIAGALDGDLFEAAVRDVVDECETLNVSFLMDGDGLWQVPRPRIDWEFHRMDFAHVGVGEQLAMDWMRADLARPADLEGDGPLFASALIRIRPDRHMWYMRYHQIALDGYGWSLFARRVAETYRALAAGTPAGPRRFESLSQVLAEQEAYRASDEFSADREYWLSQTSNILTGLERMRRPLGAARAPLRRTIHISPGAAGRLRDIAANIGARRGAFLLALVAAYQARIAAADPMVFGIPVTARTGPLAKRTPCRLSNVLPLIMPAGADLSLAQLVRSVSDVLDDLLTHQRYRSEDLRRDLAMRVDEGRFFGPLINVIRFDFDLHFESAAGTVENLSTGPVEDLSTCVFDRRDRSGLQIVLEGHPSVHSPDDMAMHERRLGRFLGQVCASLDGERPLASIEVLLPEERRWLVEGWNKTEARFPSGCCLHELVEDRARRSPDAVAVVSGDDRVTYAELDRRSAELATILAGLGAGPDIPVGVWIERSVAVVVALLAVLRAGSAYVPLDADVPVARILDLLADAGAPVMVTGMDFVDRLDDCPAAVVAVDSDGRAALNLDPPIVSAPAKAVHPENLVSIYYTSGSTGSPKGVASTHRGWVNRMWWMQQFHGLLSGEAVLHKTVLSFDDSAVEVFWPLIAGGTVVLLPPGRHRDPRAILDAAVEHTVTALQFVPSVLAGFLDEINPKSVKDLQNLRHVITSGEALRPELVRLFFDRLRSVGCRLVNQFGATEVSIDATAHVCQPDDALGTEVPIGIPIANTHVYILDEHLAPVPVGAVGEIYLAGAGLARGYWRDPAKTAAAFVPDPFGVGSRLYRTGDLGFRRTDGRLVFLGRADHQMKIRGIRVEPAEIEAALRTHTGVAQAVVVKWEPSPDDQRLAAYLTPADPDTPPDASEVRAFLAERLPPYLVPAAFAVIDAIPLTSAGKTDRRRLPQPTPDEDLDVDDNAVASEAEGLIAQVWREVLVLDRVGLHQDFFALGGNSLLATRVISRLRRRLGVDLPLSLVFDHPTVASQATALTALDGIA